MVSVRLEPMTDEQFRDYRDLAVANYANGLTDSGVAPADAQREAAESTDRLLPEGLHTPDHHLWTAYDGDTEVGILWLRIRDSSAGPQAFGFDLQVREPLRRHGYGRAIMVAAEQFCRERGVVAIGLHVFAANTGARELYEQMGFEVTSSNMRKVL